MRIKGAWQASGDIAISWLRRTRSLAGDSWTAPEVPLGETTESYDLEMLNVAGTMTVCGEAALRMAETGGGSIINIGTLATTVLQPKMAEYSSTKIAMIAASKTLAREMGRKNVRVHVVTPGYTTGEPLDRLFEQMAAGMNITPEEMSRRLAKSAVLERHVDPEDIAEACLFLASDRARNITGIELHVTAGQSI